ncbi:MAG: MMPL family transporter [Deltaproteobacteria bacterium]|nr:MMPL family transporter [Deltaproteobacteria bacterium]
MRRRGRAATIVVLLGVAIGFAVATPYFQFTTKITEFLPDDSEDRGAQIAALLAESELSRVMMIDLTLGEPAPAPKVEGAGFTPAPGVDRLRTLALSLVDFLRAQPDVASARSGFTEADVTAMLEFLGRWTATTFVPRDAYTDAELRARLTKLKEDLGGPMGMLIRQTAPRDPLGGTWEPLEALRGAQGTTLVDEDGVVFTADRLHAFVFVETRSSTFQSDAQIEFRRVLDAWMARSAPPPARMQTAGTAQYAIASEAQIKGDVNRIGIISTVGILIVFLVLFGSLRLIALGIIPMVFGSAVAVLVCQALFGEIHGITIAFGTSLLGVGLDYVEHYYAHFVLTPEVPAAATMKRVAPSIALGALTTIIGFVGIAASGLGGLRQMAVFSVVAIIASMTATIWIVPQWMPTKYQPPRTLALMNRIVLAFLVKLTSRIWSRTARLVVIALAVLATVAGVGAAQFSDNVNMLVNEQGPHVVEDRAVRARLGPDTSSFAVVTAPTDEALLAAIGTTTAELERARAAGHVTSFVALDRILPSREEQTARLAAARAAEPRIRSVMTELEFVPDQFADFWAALAEPAPAFLSLADLRTSPLAPLLTAWVPAQSTPIALIPLVGVTDVGALRAVVPSATIVVPQETIVELFRGVRIRTVVSSLIGFAAIFLLLGVRYRSGKKALVALAPALLACVATVGTLVAIGTPLTILHVMSLLLVVSLGVDFGIFFVDTTESLEESARTMISILTAAVTTILSFGLLGLSASPGLAAIGVTVTLGVSFSLVFCFVMASLAGPRS